MRTDAAEPRIVPILEMGEGSGGGRRTHELCAGSSTLSLLSMLFSYFTLIMSL